jgi:hypothetical protein
MQSSCLNNMAKCACTRPDNPYIITGKLNFRIKSPVFTGYYGLASPGHNPLGAGKTAGSWWVKFAPGGVTSKYSANQQIIIFYK